MSNYSTFTNFKCTKISRNKALTCVDALESVEGKDRGHPSIYSYYRAMGYQEGLLCKKGMSNVSTLQLGDERLRVDTTVMHLAMKMVDDAARECGVRGEYDSGDVDLRSDEGRDWEKDYMDAIRAVGVDSITLMESSMRSKLGERTGGGAFQLRKTFKFFDKDSSGTIDIDEFSAALSCIGFGYTGTQVLALFARYDNDLDGAINYNEFVQGLMETDFGPHARNTTTAAVAGDLNELEKQMRSRQDEYLAKRQQADGFEPQQVEQLERKEVTRLLALSDGDSDGLPLLIARLGLLPSPAVINSARAQVLDENGRVSLEPLLSWWRGQRASAAK